MSLVVDNIEVAWAGFELGPVSLKVTQGQYTGILGPSGSGKTTFLRTIAGLQTIKKGEIHFGNEKWASASQSLTPEKRNIGFVFQNLALWPHLSVVQHLQLVLKYQNREGDEEAIQNILETVRLSDLRDKKPDEMSGGEGQRLALARALVTKPRLLLLDEPFAQLDPHLREELVHVIEQYSQQNSMAVIHVTHHPAELLQAKAQVVLLRSGRVEQIGTLVDLVNNPVSPFVAQYFRPLLDFSEQFQALLKEAR